MDDKSTVFVGGFYEAYDGKEEVGIAFVIKHRVSVAATTAYQFLDKKCKIALNQIELVGTPYMGKITKNKYVYSIVFGKRDNGEDEEQGRLMRILSALSGVSNVAMSLEAMGDEDIHRVDSQFWEKIHKTLRDIAAYSGVASDWEEYKGWIKREYGLSMSVAPYMSASDAETFYDAAISYAEKNNIPIRKDDPILRDVENYIAACRKEKKCCVCGNPIYDDTVYPVCQDHFDEYLELGKAGFEHKHYY